jgi:predicted lipoprotein with Yx(FWY)xxD motif
MITRHWLVPLLATGALGAAIAGCGGGGTSTAAMKATTSSGLPAAVKVASVPKVGKILVDSRGRTLYRFGADKGTRSTCTGACATEWPPLRAANGGGQVTYNGHPLYLFEGDHRSGDANGQGLSDFGGTWTAVSPAGPATSGSSPSSGSSSSAGGYGGY